MIGNRVRVYRIDGSTFEGVLHRQDANGVVVEKRTGIADYDERLFIPYAQMSHMKDLGRAP